MVPNNAYHREVDFVTDEVRVVLYRGGQIGLYIPDEDVELLMLTGKTVDKIRDFLLGTTSHLKPYVADFSSSETKWVGKS